MTKKYSVKTLCQKLPGFRAAATLAATLMMVAAVPASADTLERIKESGQINLGYFVNARPFTYSASGGKPEGYGVDLCTQIAGRVKKELGLGQLKENWVPVTGADYLSKVKDGGVDLLCTPINETVKRRKDVSFSISVFPGGIRAVMRKDAALSLREALGETPSQRPLWRGSPAAKVLSQKSFGVVAGTSSEAWLGEEIQNFQIHSKIVPVADYEEGVKKLLDRKIDVFFGDRAVVLGAMDAKANQELVVLDRLLTHEPYELTLARNDDDFRLLVDSTLSDIYANPAFGDEFFKWFGEYDLKTRLFFEWKVMLP
ncbi:MAG TPA: amino acid ABC transporter substrate-binding protein [Cellvibrio sp.]|nr:amino acid ABC transporter substrate-binding protein [Cellvibrio sp.]